MKTIQLANDLFVDVADGDMFIYTYPKNHIKFTIMQEDNAPQINEFAVEILSFYSKRHFVFHRDNNYYWWSEINY